jgi:hypothetical protein
VLDRLFDRLEGVPEDLDQQEDEDPRRRRVEERAQRPREIADSPDGQTEKDREAGDGAKQEYPGFGQRASFQITSL